MKKKSSPLIIYDRLGCTCIRRRPTQVRDPKTPRQLLQREKLSLAVAVAKQYAPQLSREWHACAHRKHVTGLNLLVGHIMRCAMTLREGHWVVDTSRIDLQSPWR